MGVGSSLKHRKGFTFILQSKMKHFLTAIPLVNFMAAHAALQVTPTESNSDMRKKSQSNVINYYYVGPNCKKLEQHLAEMKIEILEEIRSLLSKKESGGPNPTNPCGKA